MAMFLLFEVPEQDEASPLCPTILGAQYSEEYNLRSPDGPHPLVMLRNRAEWTPR